MSTRERKTAWLCLGLSDKGDFRLGLEEREGREGGCQPPRRFLQMVWGPWGFLASSGENLPGNSLVRVTMLPGEGRGAEPLSWAVPYHPAGVCGIHHLHVVDEKTGLEKIGFPQWPFPSVQER